MSVLPEKYRHIVVEGPIGAGKTSLARRIADVTGAALMLEAPDENPFLAKFYRDMPRYALPTQLFFLFQRIHQLSELKQPDMFKGRTVGDFLFEKDPLFARMTLNDDELGLYGSFYIEHVTYNRSSDGTFTMLRLMRPEDLVFGGGDFV
jgi:deoxyadenosine/deoxycytidine kinase